MQSQEEMQYDAIIAPMLTAVAARCADLDMSFVARVEWLPDEGGSTHIGVTDKSGVAQRLTLIAALSHGNIDNVCIQAMKHFDVSQSMFLSKYTK